MRITKLRAINGDGTNPFLFDTSGVIRNEKRACLRRPALHTRSKSRGAPTCAEFLARTALANNRIDPVIRGSMRFDLLRRLGTSGRIWPSTLPRMRCNGAAFFY